MNFIKIIFLKSLQAVILVLSIFYSDSVFAQKISGRVLSELNSKGVSKAQIFLIETDQTIVADSLGRFSFNKPTLENIRMKVSANDFQNEFITFSNNQTELSIYLKPAHVDLNEITISGSSTQVQNQNPFHIETRKLSELNHISAMNMGEIISRIPGVYQSSLGNGISKPVIRGLQGMRVVSLLNGLRIEGQQWGGDHGMGIAELGVGSVEVIKGPVSLLYGADALGGVIYFADVPFAATGTREFQVQTQGQSNTMGGIGRFLYKESREKLRWMLGASYVNHADFQLPTGKFAQNSRFNELVLKGALAFNGKQSVHNFRYNYNHTTTGIPGHTHDSLATPETFQVDEQKRVYTLPAQFFSNHYFSSDNKWFTDKNEYQALVGVTFNQLIEYDEKVTIPSLSMGLLNSVYNVKWTNKSIKNVKFISGFQGMFQRNVNATNASDTLIPNSLTYDNGLYSTIQYSRNLWNFQAGIRYDIRQINSLHVFNGNAPLTRNFGGVNSSLGSVYGGKTLTFRTSLSTGYRAPHLTELLSNGFHHGALRYEIGNVNLNPEYASQIDITTEITKNHFVLVINPFVNYIRNYIYLQPIDSLVENIPVFEYRQLSSVLFYGGDIGIHYHPHFAHNLHLESSLSLIYTTTNKDSSISLIPQPRFQNSIRYTFDLGKKLILKELFVQYTYMGEQNNVAFNELPSQDYHLLDASISFEWKKNGNLKMNMGCKNILNMNYIDHLSRLKNISMPGPGRNFYIGINYNLSQNLKNKLI
jgi:iron complex outermembrane receptor protein